MLVLGGGAPMKALTRPHSQGCAGGGPGRPHIIIPPCNTHPGYQPVRFLEPGLNAVYEDEIARPTQAFNYVYTRTVSRTNRYHTKSIYAYTVPDESTAFTAGEVCDTAGAFLV